jgi:hypothetical protein
MISAESKAVAEEARRIYESRLRHELEATHTGKYLCLEPSSGEYFLADTFDEAVDAALVACPGRLTHTLRIGHPAAVHLGVMIR